MNAREVLKKPFIVTPAKAEAQGLRRFWIPAYAGMTVISEFPSGAHMSGAMCFK
jgi:hypothetical protein